VKPATIRGWRHSLDRWLLPNIGNVLLADVGNAALKSVIEKMAAAGLSAQSIVTHSRVVKMVVASAVNDEGDQIYPRKWNHDFIGLPIIDPTKQHRPSLTREEAEAIVSSASSPRWATLFSLLAGTGLRIGEALGLKTTDFRPDCRVVSIRRSLWNGKEQDPKTPNAVRVVDVSEPLAAHLRGYMAGRSGYVFATANGRCLGQRNALRALHATGKIVGFHAFRRFRAETLRRYRVPEDLIRLWLGHSKQSMTDLYASGLASDEAWRQQWCEQVGIGFGLQGLQTAVQIQSEEAA
jgi:integrase